MRIKRVEIIGFKSFCDRAVVEIGESITGVVGPNGCGKSNIVDAIRWTMGEQSAKHLRGKAMEDVIFAGSETRGPAPMAEVSLTFDDVGFSHETLELAKHDSQDAVLDALPDAPEGDDEEPETAGTWTDKDGNKVDSPVEEVAKLLEDAPPAFEFSHYTEVTITRRLYRDGVSQYFINKTLCRLRDITDFFLGTGVGTKAYAIIEQGRIGQIVSARAQDRRAIIEEAAGITKFKAKKKAAERKLDQTRQNLMRVSDITTELDKRMGTLRRQAQKAERYRKYKGEMRDIELCKSAHRWLELHGESQLVGARLTSARADADETRTAWTIKDATVVAERAELVVEERRLVGVQERVYELDNTIRLGDSKIGFELREADELDGRIAVARTEIEEVAGQRERGQIELDARTTELSALEEEVARESGEVATRETAASTAKESLADAESRLEHARSEVSERRTQIATAQAQLENLAHRRGEAASRLERVTLETDEHVTQSRRLEREGRHLDGTLRELRQTRLDLGSQSEGFVSRKETLAHEVARGEAEVETLRTELHRRRSRLVSLEEIEERYEGFARGTRAVMQGAEAFADFAHESGDAIRGVVADVVRAPELLEVAVEAALGDRLGGVLVADRHVGVAAIGFLKEGGGGRSAFVSLEAPRIDPFPEVRMQAAPLEPLPAVDTGVVDSEGVPRPVPDDRFGEARFESAATKLEAGTFEGEGNPASPFAPTPFAGVDAIPTAIGEPLAASFEGEGNPARGDLSSPVPLVDPELAGANESVDAAWEAPATGGTEIAATDIATTDLVKAESIAATDIAAAGTNITADAAADIAATNIAATNIAATNIAATDIAATDIAADSTTDIAADGTTDIAADGTTDIAADGTTDDGTTDIAADGTTDIAADGTTDIAADGTTDIAADAATDIAADAATGIAATGSDIAADAATDIAATDIAATDTATTDIAATDIAADRATDIAATDIAATDLHGAHVGTGSDTASASDAISAHVGATAIPATSTLVRPATIAAATARRAPAFEYEDRSQLVGAIVDAARDDVAAGEGVLGRMTDLVGFVEGYEAVGKRLLGRTVVVDHLRRAIDLHERGVTDRLVTLDGDVVDEDGVVAGGSRDAQGSGVLAQKREIRDLHEIVGRLEHDLSEAMQRLVTARTELAQVTKAIDGLRAQVHEGEVAIVGHEKDDVRVRGDLERHRDRLGQLGREQLELEERLTVIAADELTNQERRATAEQRIGELEQEQLTAITDVAGHRERLEELGRALTEARIRAAQLEAQRSAVEAATLRLARTDSELAARAERLVAECEESSRRAVGLREGCERLAAELAITRESRNSESRTLEEGRTTYQARVDALSEIELAARELRTKADALGAELTQLELRHGQIKMTRQVVEDQVSERYQLDVTEVLHEYHQRPTVGEVEESRLTELRELIDRMGTDINLTAIEEFADVSQRFEFLSAQKIDLERAVDQLQKAIDKINKTSRKLFRDTFAAVNATFKEVFPRLFRGGHAALSISNEEGDLLEAGIDIMAQPPGKKNVTIDQLSGGEKALTAVALVFSIFLIKPSPFCILDEVDAPLDEANVDRYNELVREMTDRSQFIVITHNKRTMESADSLYGVTMQEPGVSKLVSVNLSKLGPSDRPPANKPAANVVAI